jgi:hypothetical protein
MIIIGQNTREVKRPHKSRTDPSSPFNRPTQTWDLQRRHKRPGRSQLLVKLDPQPRPLQWQRVPIHNLRAGADDVRLTVMIHPERLQQRHVRDRGPLGLAACSEAAVPSGPALL